MNALSQRAAIFALAAALAIRSAAPAQEPPPARAAKPAGSPPTATAAGEPGNAPSALADRLGWNSRERTAAGIEALAKGDAAAGQAALDTALRLRPSDPTARFNAGTGRLAAGDPSAGTLLDLAARDAPAALAPSAWYNLGEAKLAEKEYQGAARAFVETLKRAPDHAAAKHNLELALRELQKQQQEQQQQQQQQDEQQKPNEDQQKNDGSDPDEQNRDQKPSESNDPSQQEQQEGEKNQQPGTGDESKNDPNRQPQPGENGQPQPQKPGDLPQFKDLPDMTADQAAAILRAVENLERQQRQERAAKAAKASNAAVEIDW